MSVLTDKPKISINTNQQKISASTLHFGKGKYFKYDNTSLVNQLIEFHAEKNSNHIAVIFKNQKLTYAALNNHANQLAHYLLKKGAKPQDRIGIFLNPSQHTVISILAVLKIGGCYVPLDISYPPERLKFMLDDSACNLIITELELINIIELETNKILIDKELEIIRYESSANIAPQVSTEDPAYIIYTSGSTGVPKGVVIHHSAINNHMTWMQFQFKLDQSDVILLKTPLSFDPSIWEIFLPLTIGAKLVIAPRNSHLDPKQLIQVINKHKITIIQLVPTLLYELLKRKEITSCKSLKHIFCGGESLGSHIKRLFFETMNCNLHNLYGPAEATVDTTFHTVSPTDYEINANLIGKPIFNTQLYALNSQMEICNVNEEGELYIGGDGLSKGYFNRPELNIEKFINNPFIGDKKEKIYKTGDIVRWQENGVLEYLGRNNEQIKINGVRIELGEITTKILENKQVKQCNILLEKDIFNHDILVCYLVSEDSYELDINLITSKLKLFFPTYMLPKKYFVIDETPLTVNGKVDTQALSKIFKNEIQAGENPNTRLLTDDEQKCLTIWQEILGDTNINLNDNFFDKGGHSLLALQLISKFEEIFNLTLKVSDIFHASTILDQVKLFEELRKKKNRKDSPSCPIIPLHTSGNKTPIFLIHPVGGTVFWYTSLAKLLDKERPIYGIQDPGIDAKKMLFRSIKHMAEFYAEEIRQIQPKGPYIIGGASFGATVAIEVANCLTNANETIMTIPIFDGWGVYPETLRDDNYFKESMRRQQNDLHEQFTKYGMVASKNLLNLQKHRLNLLWKYNLKHVSHRIVLFKAREILPVFEPIDDSLNHWDKFATNKIDCFNVPGNHETMFQFPHVDTLVQLIKNYLEKIQA